MSNPEPNASPIETIDIILFLKAMIQLIRVGDLITFQHMMDVLPDLYQGNPVPEELLNAILPF
jgi:hypothetical protein